MKILLSPLILITTVILGALAAGNEWEQVFRAGTIDCTTGRPIRGTEIVHLVTHQSRLYAGNGYWMDTRGYANIPWAQVIVLDSPDGNFFPARDTAWVFRAPLETVLNAGL